MGNGNFIWVMACFEAVVSHLKKTLTGKTRDRHLMNENQINVKTRLENSFEFRFLQFSIL